VDGIYDVLFSDRILKIAPQIDARTDKVINAEGMWVIPGLIDMHAHFREPGQEHKETIYTGNRAAAKGGFTTVCVMANTNPVIDNVSMVEHVLNQSKIHSLINILPIGAVTVGLDGKALTDIGGMVRVGAVAFSDDGKYVADTEIMKKAMLEAKKTGKPILAHCEDLTKTGREAELAAIERDIKLARETGAKLHICHVSVETPELYKSDENVTFEITPHHFTLCEQDAPINDTNYKMSPPLRGRTDMEAVRKALQDGKIAVIATDHAPHSAAEKKQPYADAPNGVIGLETAVPLALEALGTGFVEKMTVNPAGVLGIDKGTLSIGADADITVIDPNKEYTIREEIFASKSRNSPFIGRNVRGAVIYTVYMGNIIVEKGELK
jgi:dihydroorotase